MHHGLHTHFEAPIGLETLQALVARYVEMVRIDAQTCSRGLSRRFGSGLQPGGTIHARPAGTAGGYEEFRIEGNRAVFPDVSGLVFTIPLVE